jgi:hypothetical protein
VTARTRRSHPLAGVAPLSPRRKWRAILLATLLWAPGYWAMVAGLVSLASDEPEQPLAAPYIAFGLALIPFVFLVLAIMSEHPRAPGAVLRAMALSLLVGIPVSAIASDAVTGLVAGLGAGGIVALRADVAHSWKARAAAVAVVTIYSAFLLRTVTDVALVVGPALPFTILGIADHLSERKRDREATAGHGTGLSRSDV